jgi:putative spermidine/putrescine transport system ATP-binding protein/spermidine/putrescine transport system ATP-binding protein
VEPLAGPDGPTPCNTVDAIIEQIVYHGFVSHLYLRRPNGDPLIVFQQNQGQQNQGQQNQGNIAVAAGMKVRARWVEASNHIVRD